MCHQVSYRLLCEHIKTQMIFCADAIIEHRAEASGSNKTNTGGRSSSIRARHRAGVSSKTSNSYRKIQPSSSSVQTQYKRPCANLSIQALPYPTPPSFSGNLSSFASSPLSPRCPLLDCPFEQKHGLWNCCWCGKAYNRTGRCSCVMLIEDNHIRCEHICCHQCTAAADTAGHGGL
ncbi:hypothetical protein QBC38DRAFT_471004 [Podospora fimiseda]|uniref:Uncharacterized protein n=1 Tax=Podospora fimiseda TaxID=252190 RepID=A0AAN7BVI8_9PEZI|nr:hypothetical protein QBC38DRAFT_471004 [Podospora fimiseda]